MVRLLQRNYPDGELLEVYDRDDWKAPAPTPQGFADYIASMDPEVWEQVRCITGHLANFAIPVLTEPFQMFTVVRDPVDRVVSLYHYVRGRAGFGERGDRVGQLIRDNDWSLQDIYERFGGAFPRETPDHQLFMSFFNGQARTILAPHFRVDYLPMARGRPAIFTGLVKKLDWVLSEYYLLGSASRYQASVERFAAAFGWADTTVSHDNATPDRPALDDLDPELIQLIREYNSLDEEIHQRALSGLAETPERSSTATAAGGVTRVTKGSEPSRESELTGESSDAVAGRELIRLRTELAATERALATERSDHERLRGASAARDRRMEALGERLNKRERELVGARQGDRELAARVAQLEAELGRLEELLAGLVVASGKVGTELGLAISRNGDSFPEHDIAVLEATLERAHLALVAAAQERAALSDQLNARAAEVSDGAGRERRLNELLADLEPELARARSDVEQHAHTVSWLLEERRALIEYARGLASSRAWRYGHGASRVLRRVTFRPAKKQDGAADVLLRILEAPPELPSGQDPGAGTRRAPQ